MSHQEPSQKAEEIMSFSQICKLFEAKSTPREQNCSTTSKPVKSIAQLPSTDFQKLYPIFKEYFTKRQFSALETCFISTDKNHDGFLEAKEVKSLLESQKYFINLCDADEIIKMGDYDNDGRLSAKEFVELCRPMAETLRTQQHMEGHSPISDTEFLNFIVLKLKEFITPDHVKVKGAVRFFERIVKLTSKTDTDSKGVSVKSESMSTKPKSILN